MSEGGGHPGINLSGTALQTSPVSVFCFMLSNGGVYSQIFSYCICVLRQAVQVVICYSLGQFNNKDSLPVYNFFYQETSFTEDFIGWIVIGKVSQRCSPI